MSPGGLIFQIASLQIADNESRRADQVNCNVLVMYCRLGAGPFVSTSACRMLTRLGPSFSNESCSQRVVDVTSFSALDGV